MLSDRQSAAAAGKPRSRWHSQKAAPYVFVLPFILSFLLFFAYPLVHAIVMSFQSVLPGDVRFVGWDNYRKLWNEDFRAALLNNTRYTIWTVIVLIPLPLLLAVFLNSKKMPASRFFRSTLFIPSLMSVVVAGIVFRLIFGETDGALMNTIVRAFGGHSRQWLYSSSLSMFAMVFLASWRWAGVNLIYFLSALQSVPKELYEAAEIDGAGAPSRFFRITVPLMKPITIYVLTISIYGGFAMFTESFTLWAGKPSPQNIGLTMVGYIYQEGFTYFNLGFGSAIGITLLAITLIVSFLQLHLFGLFGKEE